MQLSPEQRQAIIHNCLPMSWQMTTAWRLQHQGAATDEPDVLVDWLQDADPRSQAQVLELVKAGGWPMIPLLMLSALALVTVLGAMAGAHGLI